MHVCGVCVCLCVCVCVKYRFLNDMYVHTVDSQHLATPFSLCEKAAKLRWGKEALQICDWHLDLMCRGEDISKVMLWK